MKKWTPDWQVGRWAAACGFLVAVAACATATVRERALSEPVHPEPEQRPQVHRGGNVIGVAPADGGLWFTFEDGGGFSVPAVEGGYCEADAGAFLEVLAAGRCERDLDCEVYRHGLGVDALDLCYAVHAHTRGSRKFEREYEALSRACGQVTAFSTQDCSRAVCANHKCVLAAASDDPVAAPELTAPE